MVVSLDRARQLVYYWYAGRGRVLAGEFVSALYRARDSALYRRADEALVRFMAPYPVGGEEASDERLQAFIAEMIPLLTPHIPGRD